MTIVFRGQGKRISAEEKRGWHKDVNVRFQPKAWFDDALCESYARKEVEEMCSDAKRQRRETVFILDNLSGQTTQAFADALKRHNAKRHLLPTGVTDEMQLIDDGVGIAVKNKMGDLFDDWAMEGDHFERWTAEKASDAGLTPLAAWEKRVLITTLAAQAWEHVSNTFDFEKSATRLGMLMTVDGTDDDKIKIQGLDNYTFADEDGGEEAQESDQDGDDEDIQGREADVEIQEGGGDEEDIDKGDSSDDEEYENAGDSSDSDDDTAEPGTVRTSIGDARPPNGYSIVPTCPNLTTPQQRAQLIGKTVLVGWDDSDKHGWFIGVVHSTNVCARDKQHTPTANFVVKYTKNRTNNVLNGLVACELSERTHGVQKWWVRVEKAAS